MHSLGPYHLISKLGEGGMGEIFKAVKKGPDDWEKPVALKRILPFYADNHKFLKMLANEARLAARLSHPNLIEVHDFFSSDDTHYMALEYLHGRNFATLEHKARKSGTPIPWQVTLHIFCEVLKGLEYAHKKADEKGKPLGIVHRDVSPQNILLSYEGMVKLSDFGIARANIGQDRTETGVLKGKERYFSPEQVKGKKIDSRSDLFSLAVVLYEALWQTHPFRAENDHEMKKRIEAGDFDIPEKFEGDMPREIHNILAKGLAAEPDERFQEASQFREALMAIQKPQWLVAGTKKVATWFETFYPPSLAPQEKAISKTPAMEQEDAEPQEIHSHLFNEKKSPARVGTQVALLSFFGLVVFLAASFLYIRHGAEAPIPYLDQAKENPGRFRIAYGRSLFEVPPPPSMRKKRNFKGMKPTAASSYRASRSHGTLLVEGPTKGEVYIKGKFYGRLPMRPQRLSPGDYLVLISLPDGHARSKRVKVHSGKKSIFHWDSHLTAAK